MIVRQGFVSNSSSSSFICMVSGRVEAGMDLGMEDAGMCECENGHVFGEDHLVQVHIDMEAWKDKNDEDWRYYTPAEACPICTMQEISPGQVLRYLIKRDNIDVNELKDQIREQFGDFKTLTNYVNNG